MYFLKLWITYLSPGLRVIVRFFLLQDSIDVGNELIMLCGLHHNIKFIKNDNYNVIRRWHENNIKFTSNSKNNNNTILNTNYTFNLIITDHIKNDYLPTLQYIEKLNLILKNSLFLADNVIVFSLVDLISHLRYVKI